MSIFTPPVETLHDLYISELRDLYSAETQLIEALPKMARASTSNDLKHALKSHLEETKNHAGRLMTIFNSLGENPTGKTSKSMQALIKEGEDYVGSGASEAVRDAALISAAQRVEHYEIAAYGTVRSLAIELQEHDAAELLQQTLNEEAAADKKLTVIAEDRVNALAKQA